MTVCVIILFFAVIDTAFWAATLDVSRSRPLWQAWLPGIGFYWVAKLWWQRYTDRRVIHNWRDSDHQKYSDRSED